MLANRVSLLNQHIYKIVRKYLICYRLQQDMRKIIETLCPADEEQDKCKDNNNGLVIVLSLVTSCLRTLKVSMQSKRRSRQKLTLKADVIFIMPGILCRQRMPWPLVALVLMSLNNVPVDILIFSWKFP